MCAGKEDSLTDLGPIPGDTKSVKSQIEALKNFTNDINDKHAQVESLNQKASDMVRDRSEVEAKVIKQPMSEVNRRWKALLDAISQRKVSTTSYIPQFYQSYTCNISLLRYLHVHVNGYFSIVSECTMCSLFSN